MAEWVIELKKVSVWEQMILLQMAVNPCIRRMIMDISPHYTGLFKMNVGVLTNCHTQNTSDSSICVFFLI